MSRVSFAAALDPAPTPDREYMVPNRQKPHRVTFTEEELPIWTASTPDEQRKARHYMHTLPKKIIADYVLKITAYLLGPEKERIAHEQAEEVRKEATRTRSNPKREVEWVYLGYIGRMAEVNVAKYKTLLLSDLPKKHFPQNPKLAELVANKICDEHLITELYQTILKQTQSLYERIENLVGDS